MNSVLNLPDGQVKPFGELRLQKNCNQSCSPNFFSFFFFRGGGGQGENEMTFGLVRANCSLREWLSFLSFLTIPSSFPEVVLLIGWKFASTNKKHYPELGSASDWLKDTSPEARPIRSNTKIWVVTRHQYGISTLLPQTSFPGGRGRGDHSAVVAFRNVGWFLRLVMTWLQPLTSLRSWKVEIATTPKLTHRIENAVSRAKNWFAYPKKTRT